VLVDTPNIMKQNCGAIVYKMASLSEIENSSQSQNQDEEVLADKPR